MTSCYPTSEESMKRLLVILGVVAAFLAGGLVGVVAAYVLIPRGVLPPPRMPDTAPWYGWLARQRPFNPNDEGRGEPIERLIERAAEAGGYKMTEPHLDSSGGIRQDGHVQYSSSWTGPTDPKKVIDYLDKEVRSFVSSKGGRRLNSGLQLRLEGEYGFKLSWEFEVQGWTGWFHAWIVPGPANRFTLVITMHPLASKWGT
jgi:hypothetical protein